MDRRHVLKLAGAFALAGAVARPFGQPFERSARAAPAARPRFYLQIIPSGGMDSIYGADPKTAREVEPGIDVPYAARAIVDAGTARLGPAFAELKSSMQRIAIVNAFRQNSANHQSGLVNTTCCRGHATSGTPTLLDVLGTRRDGQAMGAISIGTAFSSAFSPKYLGEPTTAQFGARPGLLEHLDQTAPDELVAAARVLRRDAASFAARSSADRVTAENFVEVAGLFERWARAPKFEPVDWGHPDESWIGGGRDLQRALWLFEHGLARCATVSISGQAWDTHSWNDSVQTRLGGYLAGVLGQVIEELDRRVVDGRSLAAQTAVFVGSEIGRFPRLNKGLGKDHFPQVAYLFVGPWFATGAAYGGTDRQMVALPVALDSGKPERGGKLLAVDDIGTTLLHLDGANPELFGYTGRHLRFLAG
jgi:uncharacterized protein (DUF1501 family)